LERLVDELKTAPLIDRPTRKRPPRGDGSPAARIKRILTVEAGLQSDQAISQLRAELMRIGQASLPPAGGKLESWLKSALEALPAGEVLNAAMTIAARSIARKSG